MKRRCTNAIAISCHFPNSIVVQNLGTSKSKNLKCEREINKIEYLMKKLTKKVHSEEQFAAQSVERSDDEGRRGSKIPIVYSKKYSVRFGGLEKLHPFDAAKGKHIRNFLLDELNLEKHKFHEPEAISKEELLKVHTTRYIKSLKWSINAARISEIPILVLLPNFVVQRSYLKPMRYQTGGSLLAAKIALENGWSINLGGGFHHCYADKGAGFCPYADITLLIKKLWEVDGHIVKKVMIVDLDAHQGNGHERDFMDVEDVFILDMYNASIYPRDQFAKLAISCAVELLPHTGDATYLKKLKKFLDASVRQFNPDFVVYNAGTDVLKGDPLGYLDISPEGIIERDEIVFSCCRSKNIPIVMLLSGGYTKKSAQIIADSIKNLRNLNLAKF